MSSSSKPTAATTSNGGKEKVLQIINAKKQLEALSSILPFGYQNFMTQRKKQNVENIKVIGLCFTPGQARVWGRRMSYILVLEYKLGRHCGDDLDRAWFDKEWGASKGIKGEQIPPALMDAYEIAYQYFVEVAYSAVPKLQGVALGIEPDRLGLS